MTEMPRFQLPDALASHGIEFLPDGLIAAVGPEARIRFMNGHAQRISGVSVDVAMGADLREVLPLRDVTGESWWDIANPWVGLATRTGHREKLLLLPNGAEVLVTARYIRRERLGPLAAVVVGLRDAEGRRRAEAESAALLSTVAHELRSPLTGVKGFSSTLLRNWDRLTDDQKRLMLQTIEADADRVTRLISELLDSARIESGRLRIHPIPTDVAAIFDRARERVVSAGLDPEAITTSVSPQAPELWADPDKLEQVVTNLVDNAVTHGGGRVALSTEETTHHGRGAVALLVDDDGPGIPERLRVIAFRRFWQAAATPGMGLGLHLVHGFVHGHGGTVEIEDSPLGGTRIRAVFPDPEV